MKFWDVFTGDCLPFWVTRWQRFPRGSWEHLNSYLPLSLELAFESMNYSRFSTPPYTILVGYLSSWVSECFANGWRPCEVQMIFPLGQPVGQAACEPSGVLAVIIILSVKVSWPKHSHLLKASRRREKGGHDVTSTWGHKRDSGCSWSIEERGFTQLGD